ncbi:MAG: LysM peptidoglycan-binding domain-containing protein [Peptococcaceae bacterium]
MDFYLRDKSGQLITFPLSPQKVEVRSGALLQSFNIVQLGEIKIPRGNSVTGISWEGMLPGEARKEMPYVQNWQEPQAVVERIERYKTAGEKLRLLITESPLNLDVYIETFAYSWQGGFGDVQYRLNLVQVRELNIFSTTEQSGSAAAQTARSSPPPPKTYTVKPDDTLYGIAKKLLGNGGRYLEIYQLNRDIIGEDYNLIIPGQVFRIPGGEAEQ